VGSADRIVDVDLVVGHGPAVLRDERAGQLDLERDVTDSAAWATFCSVLFLA
jgi:hypothetical protein